MSDPIPFEERQALIERAKGEYFAAAAFALVGALACGLCPNPGTARRMVERLQRASREHLARAAAISVRLAEAKKGDG